MGPRVGGYVPQGLTTLPMLVITFFSLSIATFSHFCSYYFEFVSLLVGLLVLTCLGCLSLLFSKNLSQEAMLLNTHTAFGCVWAIMYIKHILLSELNCRLLMTA